MTVRIGLIGAGIMGADHADILRRGVPVARLAAVYDADRERARQVARANEVERIFETATDLISDPGIDAVIIASPDETHAALAIACIERGKPVLCEKPLASTLEGCRDIVAAEVKGGRRVVQVGFMRRFDPGYRAMKGALDATTLGLPLFMHCVHRNAFAPHYITSELVIANSTVHEIDIARYVLSEEFVAATVVSPRPSTKAPTRQPQFVVLETESGIVVDIEAFLDAQYGYDVRAELVCEAGTISLAPNPPIALRVDGRDGFGLNPDWRGRFEEAYRAQMMAWVGSITGGRHQGSNAWDGYVASLIAADCLTSFRDRARIPIRIEEKPAIYLT